MARYKYLNIDNFDLERYAALFHALVDDTEDKKRETELETLYFGMNKAYDSIKKVTVELINEGKLPHPKELEKKYKEEADFT